MNLDYRSVPYRILENATRIVGFLIIGAFSGGSRSVTSLAGLLLVGMVLVGIWEAAEVQAYEYRIDADTFDIYSGVVSRREREIPFDRIQNVDIAQNVVQRALGIAEVRLETAGGGGDSEARLQYVSRQEANRLQELISKRKQGDVSERDPGARNDILFELDRRELGILGVTSANVRLLGLLGGLFVIASPVAADQISPRLSILLLLGPAFAVAGLILLWIASGVQAVLRYYGFRLYRHDEELRYKRGLLQQYDGTIPLSKIQTLMIRENLLARSVGYGSLAIETAGYAPGQSDSVESAVPIAKRERVLELARTIEDIGDPEFERAPKRARTRYVARYTIIVGLLTAIAGGVHLFTDAVPLWFLTAGLWILVPPAAHLKWKNIGYTADENYIITQSGFWTRRTTIVPYYRVQTVSTAQSVFQRRRDLGTLVVDTATSGGFWGGDAVALDIDIEEAEELREQTHDRFQRSLEQRRLRLLRGERERVEPRRATSETEPDRRASPAE
ncbi:PH domain-containing protein [Halovenus sp. WSH3]|uniref:PH domain-containing protein n=1 Tax=Halovenus carboxidivorans TaxID=2692199 RepID=A0A6B0SZY1_9EURY|nr:PH domain-containing protein [Halovenus carboxidivorans]MXR51264.1 PH domain-containing protein [Halovenus carboxidivorans]